MRVYCNKCFKELGLKENHRLFTIYVGMKCDRCGKVIIEEDKNGEIKYNW